MAGGDVGGLQVKQEAEEEEDFCVECSDDELYGPEKGVWQPAPADIIELYGKLAKGEKLELEWKCPGRMPSNQGADTPQEEELETPKRQEFELEKPDKPPVFNEFDFDEPVTEVTRITPRRTPGAGRTPKGPPKRVARLDKIMSDIMRHRKIDADAAKAERGEKMSTAGSANSPGTPGFQGGSRGGSPKGYPGSPKGYPTGPSGSPKGQQPLAGMSPKAQQTLGGSPKGMPPPSGSPKGGSPRALQTTPSTSPKGLSGTAMAGSPKGPYYFMGGSPKPSAGGSPKGPGNSPKGLSLSSLDKLKEYDMPP